MEQRILLTLMVLASVAMADDPKMKKLLTGTWMVDCGGKTYILKSDGSWTRDGDDLGKWDLPVPAAAASPAPTPVELLDYPFDADG